MVLRGMVWEGMVLGRGEDGFWSAGEGGFAGEDGFAGDGLGDFF